MKLGSRIAGSGVLPSLLVLFVSALLVGCEGSYHREKLAWRAERDFMRLQEMSDTEPWAIEDEFVEGIIEGYRRVLERYPDGGHVAQVRLRVGLMLLQLERRDEAREEFLRVVREHADSPNVASLAHFYLGKVEEEAGRWPEAEAAYMEVIERYGWTSRALEMPLYIARSYVSRGDHKAARDAYEEAVERYDDLTQEAIDRGMPDAAYYCQSYKAQALAERRRYKEAVEVLQNVVETYAMGPMTGQVLAGIGRIYQDALQDPEKAVEPLSRVLEGYTEEGVTSSEALTELRGMRQDAAFRLGRAYLELDRYDEARAAFEAADDFTSGDKADNVACNVQIALAGTYERQGDWDRAEQLLRAAAEAFPRTREALAVPVVIARHYERAAETAEEREAAVRYYDDAIAYYQGLLDDETLRGAEPIIMDQIAGAQRYASRWDDYIATLESILQEYPEYAKNQAVLVRLGFTYDALMDPGVGASVGLEEGEEAEELETPEEKSRRLNKAIEYYELYLEEPVIAAPPSRILIRMAADYYALGEYDKAIEVLQRMIDENPNNTGLVLDSRRNIAQATSQKEGGWEEAERLYRQLLLDYPEEVGTLQVMLALAEHWSPQDVDDPDKYEQALDDAQEHYEAVAARNPGTELAAAALFYSARVSLMREDWEEARTLFERLADEFPDSPRVSSALTALGILYRDEDKLNDRAEAIRWFQRIVEDYPDSRGLRGIQAQLEELREGN